MLGALGGADGVVFTGGIGENQPRIRSDLLHSFGWCGIALDEHLNRSATKDGIISTEQSRATVFRIETREDLTMAREAAVLLHVVQVTP
jgi:acetate kinase